MNQILTDNSEKTTRQEKLVITEQGLGEDGNQIVIIDVVSEKGRHNKEVEVRSLAIMLNPRSSFVNLLLFMTVLLTNRI